MDGSIVFDIFTIIIAATAFAIAAKMLRQPLILAYVLAGVVIGPFGARLITNTDLINTLAEFGIALLLFVVGMELSWRRLKKVGLVSSMVGIIEVLSIGVIGFIVAGYLGYLPLEALYIGLILAFSSTMIVIKILSDKKELDTLHGRIALGILLMQDILVILALSFLINLESFSMALVGMTILKGVGLIVIAIISGKFVLPHFFKYIADSRELLFLFAIAWAFIFSALAYMLGFSIAIGAFIAGLGFATFSYSFEIISRVRPLRDFFVTIFFVSLGMQIVPQFSYSLVIPIIVFLAIVWVLKPMLISLFTSAFRYTQRTSFLTGISLAQISEFSLILVAQGFLLKHVSQELFSMTVMLAVITMTVTPYFIKYDVDIYRRVSKYLVLIEDKGHEKDRLQHIPKQLRNHVVIAGAHRMGALILRALRKRGKQVVVIDYNPELIDGLLKQDIPAVYGDLSDPDILDQVHLRQASIVISTVPGVQENIILTQVTKTVNPKAFCFVTARTFHNALILYEAGADYVIMPEILSGERMANFLRKGVTRTELKKIRRMNMEKIEELIKEDLLEKYAPAFIKRLRERANHRFYHKN